MGKNKHLIQAKKAKKDEFYTRYEDIANEIEEYYKYNPNFLKGKTVLLPCDDYKKSNFVKYFSTNFERFGIKKLIATGVSLDGKGSTYFVRNKLKLIRKTDDGNAYGDFRNELVTSLRDEADVIFTNPPFSLFREFFTWCKDKEFSILGNITAVTYNKIFSSIKEDKVWFGCENGAKVYQIPDRYPLTGSSFERDGKKYAKLGSTCWFTNIKHGKRCEFLKLDTMQNNREFNKKIKKNGDSYKHYDNYKAIEVPVTSGIPSDYDGVMGVPVTFLTKYNSEQFEIVWIASGCSSSSASKECLDYLNYIKSREDRGGCALLDNKRIYTRILIKHRATS